MCGNSWSFSSRSTRTQPARLSTSPKIWVRQGAWSVRSMANSWSEKKNMIKQAHKQKNSFQWFKPPMWDQTTVTSRIWRQPKLVRLVTLMIPDRWLEPANPSPHRDHYTLPPQKRKHPWHMVWSEKHIRLPQKFMWSSFFNAHFLCWGTVNRVSPCFCAKPYPWSTHCIHWYTEYCHYVPIAYQSS